MARIDNDPCRAKAEPDEPIFTLLGRDKHAPALVWLWAKLRERDGEKAAKIDEAQWCARDMALWAEQRGKPDMMPEVLDTVRRILAE